MTPNAAGPVRNADQLPLGPRTVIDHAVDADHIVLQFFDQLSYNPDDIAPLEVRKYYENALADWMPDGKGYDNNAQYDYSIIALKLNITEDNRQQFPTIDTILRRYIATWQLAVITFAFDGRPARYGDAIVYTRTSNLPPHPNSRIIQLPNSPHPQSLDSPEDELSDETIKEMFFE